MRIPGTVVSEGHCPGRTEMNTSGWKSWPFMLGKQLSWGAGRGGVSGVSLQGGWGTSPSEWGDPDLDLGATLPCCLARPIPPPVCLDAPLWPASPGFSTAAPWLLHASSGVAALASGPDGAWWSLWRWRLSGSGPQGP